MKKLRVLLAVITVFAMLSTVAFASVFSVGSDNSVVYDGGETVTFDIVIDADYTIKQYASFCVTFDTEKYEFVEGTSVVDGAAVDGEWYPGEIYWSCDGGDKAVAAGSTILTVTLKVLDKENFGFIKIDPDLSGLNTSTNVPLDVELNITVKAGKTETLTEATYTNADTNILKLISPYNDEETTYTNVPVFKASASGTFSLRATYDGGEHNLANGAIFDVSNFNVADDGVEFQVAIVGAPENLTNLKLFVVK